MSKTTITCAGGCGDQIKVTADSGNYQLVKGYVELRAKGANAVRFQKRYPIFVCKACMAAIVAGVADIDQQDLFR